MMGLVALTLGAIGGFVCGFVVCALLLRVEAEIEMDNKTGQWAD